MIFSPPTRTKMCVSALAGRETRLSSQALSSTLAQDPDAGVRLAALYALVERKDRCLSPDLRSAIGEVIRLRCRGEANAEVRDVACRLSGEDRLKAGSTVQVSLT